MEKEKRIQISEAEFFDLVATIVTLHPELTEAYKQMIKLSDLAKDNGQVVQFLIEDGLPMVHTYPKPGIGNPFGHPKSPNSF